MTRFRLVFYPILVVLALATWILGRKAFERFQSAAIRPVPVEMPEVIADLPQPPVPPSLEESETRAMLEALWNEAGRSRTLKDDFKGILEWLEEAETPQSFQIRTTLEIPFGETRVATARENPDGSLSFTFVTPKRASNVENADAIEIQTEEVRLSPKGSLDALASPRVAVLDRQAASIEIVSEDLKKRVDLEPRIFEDGSGVRLNFRQSESLESPESR